MKKIKNKDGKGRAQDPQNNIASLVRQQRQLRSLTLNQLAIRCDLAPSTLSKIENGLMSPTYDSIIRIAAGLNVDVTELFSKQGTATVSGRRTITRKGCGVFHITDQYDYEMLCTDLANKQFVPLLASIKANSIERFDGMLSHPGEEFVYVLSGSIQLHTKFYAPTTLEAGDSCYFDSTMAHALVRISEDPALVLWVSSKVIEPLSPLPLADIPGK